VVDPVEPRENTARSVTQDSLRRVLEVMLHET
jgi:hypothetical protein